VPPGLPRSFGPEGASAARARGLELLLLALSLVIFAIDVRIPIGMTFWLLHLVPLSLAMFAWRPLLPPALALLATLLVILDYFLSPPGASPLVSLFNRANGVIVFWVLAFVGHRHIRAKLTLATEDWIRRGQTELSARMQGELAAAEVAGRALDFLAGYLGAQVGAAWILAGAGELRRVAGHALPPDPRDRLALGEGLVGQTAQDRRLRVLGEVPRDYLVVRSSVGEHAPLHLILWPAEVEGGVQAVLELGFFAPVHPALTQLLARSGEALAVALRSAAYRTRLLDLVEETQRQAEELQAQHEELRVVNEQLERQSSALRETQAQQQRAQVELEETNANLEEHAAALEQQRDDLRRAQRELAATAEDLARASQYKSDFLANMSHELRTPLNSALILARLLADNPSDNLSEEQVKFAETIYAAGNDLLSLINDVLDLARIEAGRLDLHVTSVSLARVRDSLTRTFDPIASNRQLAFSVQLAAGTPAAIETDEGRLLQILRNLVANALKFTERGSVLVQFARAGAALTISVRDTGVGIAPEHQALVFEAFRQADGTTSRKHGGTGLGLSIARDLARLLGGDLQLSSTLGQGSTFTLTLPLARASALPAAAPARPGALPAATPARPAPLPPPPVGLAPLPPPPTTAPTRPASGALPRAPVADDREQLDGGRRLLLVIEDDPQFAEILRRLAHELDFQCLIADTADEGVRLATQHQPSGILLDVHLPDHSGMSVLERLKRRPATRHIPVHMISVADLAQRSLELGAVGYLHKPSAHADLIAAIRRIETRLLPRLRRLLIVDPDAAHAASLRELLSGDRVEIVTATSVAAAREQLRTRTFDCAVTELALADGSAFDLLEQLAGDDNLSFPPVIVHSARALSEAEEQRLRRHSAAIIVKGARSPERLLDEVTLFLHQVEAELPADHQRMLRGVRDREAIFEGRTVLIVEDDVRNIFALTSILEPKGARTLVARNGREALERLESAERVDLVLMDVMMPEMDGMEATRRLRGQPRWAKLPVIALTAKAMPDDRERCLAAGANDYLAKPINVEMLLSLMRVWMPR